MAIHAIIGTGQAPKSVIEEGLRDAIEEGDSVSLIWMGNPEEDDSYAHIYSFFHKSEAEVTIFHTEESTIPKALRAWDNVTCVKTRDPFQKTIESMSSDGAVLYLWSDDITAEREISKILQINDHVPVLELTHGLVPVDVSSGEEVVPPPPPAVKTPAAVLERLSKDELEVMTAAAVKEYGYQMGCEARTKAGIIEEMFPEEGSAPASTPASSSDVSFEDFIIDLIKEFHASSPSGFDGDMAHLALGQARLWMMRALKK